MSDLFTEAELECIARNARALNNQRTVVGPPLPPPTEAELAQIEQMARHNINVPEMYVLRLVEEVGRLRPRVCQAPTTIAPLPMKTMIIPDRYMEATAGDPPTPDHVIEGK